jgi:hypothetical protein
VLLALGGTGGEPHFGEAESKNVAAKPNRKTSRRSRIEKRRGEAESKNVAAKPNRKNVAAKPNRKTSRRGRNESHYGKAERRPLWQDRTRAVVLEAFS